MNLNLIIRHIWERNSPNGIISRIIARYFSAPRCLLLRVRPPMCFVYGWWIAWCVPSKDDLLTILWRILIRIRLFCFVTWKVTSIFKLGNKYIVRIFFFYSHEHVRKIGEKSRFVVRENSVKSQITWLNFWNWTNGNTGSLQNCFSSAFLGRQAKLTRK